MMSAPGQMNVSAAGGFSYSVPIIVPPGTAGMGPALALDYSSQNGDGPEGIGWALTGLPTIMRCPRTLAQDTAHGGVNFDSNDRFCMEGQRLVLKSGTGAYGASGSEYRTEIDSYSRIIAHGTAGSGPAWFEVHTKAGQVIELGFTADSRVLPVKADGTGTMTTARAWAVDKISDTKGNYLNVIYMNDTTNGQVYPTEIDYTGNAAGLTPYSSVKFIYTTPRPDITPTYQAGALMQTTVLLSDIKTYVGTSEVLDYQLVYTPAASAATHDELKSVTQCDGGSPQKCLAPITFGWQGSKDTLTYTAVPNSTAMWAETTPAEPSIMPGDFNGDGLTDYTILMPSVLFTCPPATGSAFYLGNTSGGFTPASPTVTDAGTTGPLCLKGGALWPIPSYSAGVIDFNGDGVSDISSTQFGNHVLVATSGWPSYQTTGTYHGGTVWGYAMDFDGDGRTDLYPYISNGDGTFHLVTIPSVSGIIFQEADFDGDGCADFVAGVYPNVTTIYYLCSPAVATYTTTALAYTVSGTSVDWTFGDFNGDGKSDIIDATGKLFLSTGTSFVATAFVNPDMAGGSGYQAVGDYNGDGKMDIAIPCGTGNTCVYLSTGSGFVLTTTLPTNGLDVIADWNNDGASDIWAQNPVAGDTEYLFHYVPELMVSVSNGLGTSSAPVTTTVTYGRLNNPAVYTKGSGATYPIQDMIGAQYVVSKVQSSDGIGGTYETDYKYAGAKTDLSGRGFMGFSQVTVSDPQLRTAEITVYRMDFPFTGQPISRTKIWTPSASTGLSPVTLSSVANTYQTDPACAGGTSTGAPYTVVLCSSFAQSNDIDGTPFPSVTTNFTYDAYGNVLTSTALVSDGSSKITTNTWLNDTTNWFLGRLLTTSVQSSVPGTATLTRQSVYTYEPASGLLATEIVEPTDPCPVNDPCLLETDYTYDPFGNKHIVTVTGKAAISPGSLTVQSRVTTATFDTKGQFATTITNPNNESEQWTYNGDFGTPASHTGPNGIATTWTYDTFGRATKEVHADGTQVAYSYVYCTGVNGGTGTCPTLGAYYVQAKPLGPDNASNGPITRTDYDRLSRPIASDSWAFDGSPSMWIRTDTVYDTDGHVAQTDRPYFLSTGTPAWTVSSYVLNIPGDHIDIDPSGRAWLATAPDASTTNFNYSGLVTYVTNPDGATTRTTKNAQGLVAQVNDANGQNTSYLYDAFGDLTSVSPPGGGTITNTYDLRGRKLTATDPDMGTWNYLYDPFGELYSQTDAKLQTVSMVYDILGRIISRTEPDMSASWTYGTSATNRNIDKLVATSCTGTACGPSYSRAYTFDSIGRPLQTTLSVGGTNYHAYPTYDTETGKIATSRNYSGFILDYAYTSRGFLSTIKDDTTPSLVYWTANKRNAEMQLTQSTAGNGVVTYQDFDPLTGRILDIHGGPSDSIANLSYHWDPVGNLLYRTDMLAGTGGQTEEFCYDPLNRLVNANLSNGTYCTGTGTTAMSYAASGNILTKTGVGTYSYGTTISSGAGPHAITSIAGTVNGVVNPTFAYDGNGNMLSGAGRTATYTSFNMVSQSTQGASTTVSLLYDPEHARVQQVSPEGTTLYLNEPSLGVMTERFVPTGGGLYWKNYILADGHIVAERVVHSTTVTVRYFTLDHIGSTTAVTTETGALAERDVYDAWGKQRNLDGTADTACALPGGDFSTRGFTGQEAMPDLCLINMNARIYDPAIGRFMTPDDVIPDQFNGQSFNRYTYVDDNPLSYTDPTGHDLTANFGRIIVSGPYETVPVTGIRDGDDSWRGGFPGPNMSPDPYWPHSEVMHTGPSSSGFGHNGAHASSTGLTSSSKSQSGLNSGAVQVAQNLDLPVPDADSDPDIDPDLAKDGDPSEDGETPAEAAARASLGRSDPATLRLTYSVGPGRALAKSEPESDDPLTAHSVATYNGSPMSMSDPTLEVTLVIGRGRDLESYKFEENEVKLQWPSSGGITRYDEYMNVKLLNAWMATGRPIRDISDPADTDGYYLNIEHDTMTRAGWSRITYPSGESYWAPNFIRSPAWH